MQLFIVNCVDIHGWGLFATKKISKHQYIASLWGRYVTAQQYQHCSVEVRHSEMVMEDLISDTTLIVHPWCLAHYVNSSHALSTEGTSTIKRSGPNCRYYFHRDLADTSEQAKRLLAQKW